MSRLDIIKQYNTKQREVELEKEKNEAKKIDELKNQIQKYPPRIKELCELIEALDEAKLLEETSQGGKQFFTDGWTHKMGLIYVDKTKGLDNIVFSGKKFDNSIKALGFQGGGACDYNLFVMEDGDIYVKGDKIYILKKFIENFDSFEQLVFTFVDNLKIQMEKDEEEKQLIEFLENNKDFQSTFERYRGNYNNKYSIHLKDWLDGLYFNDLQVNIFLDNIYEDLSNPILNNKMVDLDFLFEDWEDYLASYFKEDNFR